ncbi:class I SAM-dependent methyltransferase [Aquidulcibacter sp.]|uniref:class I SAM-dependent methyltransferase n=1 Tax=Aquidulcibacter sp. TaxID=2052990 RepID=UPI0025C1487E|nr:class I SAM-dependent methyltransferase [Aquidulcibacter sp.]MCA3695149.1 DUF2431 domain-containing protein [Aquidulcibacter sp.]
MNQLHSPARLDLERQELRFIRSDLLAVKAIIANRRLALAKEILGNKKLTPFDFGISADEGRMLLVGEGNFSFSLSLVIQNPKVARHVYATAVEKLSDAPDETLQTCRELAKLGATIAFGIDGTTLEQKFPIGFFKTIVFQFPNAGSRASAGGTTANHRLVSNFLCSAGRVLEVGGQIIITIVDNNYYHGIFDLKRAAESAGFKVESAFPFFRSHFAAYRHTNTKPTASALQSYRSCTTYRFVRARI